MIIPMSGLGSNIAINTIKTIPARANTNNGINNPILTLAYTKTSKLENVNCMKLSVNLTNMSGARGVLPCAGTPFSHIVLRRPAMPSAGGIYVQTGYARGQPKGLASLDDKPMNLAILKTHDMYNSAMNSKIGKK